jgi:hypothetical protein
MIASPQMREPLKNAVGSATTTTAGRGSVCPERREVNCLTAAKIVLGLVRGGDSRQRQEEIPTACHRLPNLLGPVASYELWSMKHCPRL